VRKQATNQQHSQGNGPTYRLEFDIAVLVGISSQLSVVVASGRVHDAVAVAVAGHHHHKVLSDGRRNDCATWTGGDGARDERLHVGRTGRSQVERHGPGRPKVGSGPHGHGPRRRANLANVAALGPNHPRVGRRSGVELHRRVVLEDRNADGAVGSAVAPHVHLALDRQAQSETAAGGHLDCAAVVRCVPRNHGFHVSVTGSVELSRRGQCQQHFRRSRAPAGELPDSGTAQLRPNGAGRPVVAAVDDPPRCRPEFPIGHRPIALGFELGPVALPDQSPSFEHQLLSPLHVLLGGNDR
jgi:hypothetical protein